MFRMVSSRIAPCHSISPTGSSPGAWHGIEIAHPSSMLTTLVLRSSSALTRKNSASRSLPGATDAMGGATIGTVGDSTAS